MSHVSEGRVHMLAEPDAAELLASFGIPYVEHGMATTAEAAVEVAGRIGYPVVLKVVSPDIVHKTEAGGVLVGVMDEAALRQRLRRAATPGLVELSGAQVAGMLVARQMAARRELIIGAIRDSTFGATVMVGLGGVFAEALEDVAFRVAPLRHRDGLDMVRELRGAAVLAEFRGEGAVDRDALAAILVRVGDLVLAHPEISEVDLNPVVASADGCVALDARVIMRDVDA